jgi:preprotein translocase subunit SecG
MMAVVIVIHAIACLGLIAIILIQRGRGGGFVESFSGLDSVFGTKTSAFLTKATTVLAVTFFFTCLTLTFLSLQQSRSLMRGLKTEQPAAQTNATSAEPLTEQQPVAQNTTSTAPVIKEEQPAAEQPASAEQKPTSEEQSKTQQFPQPRKGELK